MWEEQDADSRCWQVLVIAGGEMYSRKMAKALLARKVLRTRRELDVGTGAWAACVGLLGRVA